MSSNLPYQPYKDEIEIDNKMKRIKTETSSNLSVWTVDNLNENSPLQIEKKHDDKSSFDSGSGLNKPKKEKEKWYFSFFQILIPFLIAGMGMVGAGVLLDEVQNWNLFKYVTVINVLVPALLGLKGNLEMTLAARLSTQANIGEIEDSKSIREAVLGNFALTQLQSIVIGFLASMVACLTDYIKTGELEPKNLSTIVATSISAASIASLLLGGIVMFIIILSKKMKLNPDNIATPIASALGDLVTLAILSGFGTLYYLTRELFWLHILVIVGFFFLLPILAIFSKRNYFVKETLTQGWCPIILAMLISSVSGIILDIAIKIYRPVAIYQPVINGVGGNIVAVYASRLSTTLFRTSTMGHYASWAPRNFFHFIIDAYFGKSNPEHKVALMLITCIIPGHLIFFFIIYAIQPADEKPELTFFLIFIYILFAFAQVMCLMLLCYILIHLVWRLNKNPDNFCIPLLTGTGDLLGVIFLFLCFHLVFLSGNQSVKIQDQILKLNHIKNQTSFHLFPLDFTKLKNYL